jgi:hypothetical protein
MTSTAITIIVSIAALIITFFQWRTAYLKVVIDLFPRRMEVYTALRKVLRKIKATGHATNDDGFEFREAVDNAEFLFDDEIRNQLKEMQNTIFDLHDKGAENMESASFNGLNREAERKLKDDVERYYNEFPAIFRSYMRMDQKINLLSMLRIGLFL